MLYDGLTVKAMPLVSLGSILLDRSLELPNYCSSICSIVNYPLVRAVYEKRCRCLNMRGNSQLIMLKSRVGSG